MKSALLAAVLAIALSYAPSVHAADEEQDVKEAVKDFYEALAVIFKGDTSAMEKVWWHADDVTYMGPTGGYMKRWEQVLENFRKQAELKMGGKGGQVTPEDIRITVGQNIAVAHNLEIGKADIDGKEEIVSLRATNLFRMEDVM